MKQEYRLGLVSVSFRAYTPREIAKAAHAAGLSCIEWGSDVHARCDDRARLREIAEIGREYGIPCSSYGTYFRLGQTPMEELSRYIDAAHLLGTNILRLWCGTKSGADLTPAEEEQLLAQCRKAAELAAESGVTLCMECHQGTYTERMSDAMRLMQTVSSPHFRMYWQPFQWLEAEENNRIAAALAPYTEHIHVFHWKGNAHLKLTEGVEEWCGYLSHFSPPRTLLLEFMPDHRMESLSEEAAALKTIVGGMS